MSVADSIQGGYGENDIGVTSNGDVHIVYFNYDTRLRTQEPQIRTDSSGALTTMETA